MEKLEVNFGKCFALENLEPRWMKDYPGRWEIAQIKNGNCSICDGFASGECAELFGQMRADLMAHVRQH